MKQMPWVCIAVLTFCAAAVAYAYTASEEDFVCPVDGTEFKAWVTNSGYQSGQRLDLKPLGALVAPWDIPVCPSCHCPVVQLTFEGLELDDLRRVILSDAFQGSVEGNSPYYLIGRYLELTGEGPEAKAWCFLQASWQVEDQPERYRHCLMRVQQYLAQAIADGPEPADHDPSSEGDRATLRFLDAEILRLLGRYEEAKSRFVTLRESLPAIEPGFGPLIDFELELIASKDASPHECP